MVLKNTGSSLSKVLAAAVLGGMNNQKLGFQYRKRGSQGETETIRKVRRRGTSSSLVQKIRNLESAQHLSSSDAILSQAPVKHNTFYTHNITAQIAAGTSNSTRTNDQVFLEALKLKGYLGSNTTLTNGFQFRIVVYYADIQYNGGTTAFGNGLATSDVRLGSTGSTYTTDIIFDPKKVTILYDEVQVVNQQIASVSDVSNISAVIPLKRSFSYQPGTVYGSNRNLYVSICASSSGGTAGTTDVCSFYLSYDLIFKNSK